MPRRASVTSFVHRIVRWKTKRKQQQKCLSVCYRITSKAAASLCARGYHYLHNKNNNMCCCFVCSRWWYGVVTMKNVFGRAHRRRAVAGKCFKFFSFSFTTIYDLCFLRMQRFNTEWFMSVFILVFSVNKKNK